MEEKMIEIFRNNLGNRMTAELSSGMLNELIRIVKEHNAQLSSVPPKEVDVKIGE